MVAKASFVGEIVHENPISTRLTLRATTSECNFGTDFCALRDIFFANLGRFLENNWVKN